jgi:starch-binding outer membrane protein, SusD/RagB family
MNATITSRATRLASRLLLAGPLAALAACSFDVTNPGPVQEQYLKDPAAVQAIVNGAGRDLSNALNYIAYVGGAVAREIFPAGSTGTFGISAQEQIGRLFPDQSNDYWNFAQRARWEAEHGDSTIQSALAPDAYAKDARVAQLKLWAGYANRLLGENMCEATIDGGPRQPSTAFLTRAEQSFTDAIAIADAAKNTQLATAARAARASVRADLGNWAGAVADAGVIDTGFVYNMPYYTTDATQYNRIYEASANTPFRAHTVWHTYYEQYYLTTKDPRVPWDSSLTQKYGDAAVLTIGQVPWHRERKYTSRSAAIRLSSGWEMRLIQAEAALRNNDVAGAMALVNMHRDFLKLAPWTAADAAEAWTMLKRERGIELWLEGRRLNDLRRWDAAKTPGDLSVYEVPNATSYLDPARDLCFPVPNSELNTNPNL